MKTHASTPTASGLATANGYVRQYLDGKIYQPPAEGPAVRDIQEDLNVLLDARSLDEDGIYGPNTAEAVRVLQESAGITIDGAVGPETKSVLKRRLTSARRESGKTPATPVGPSAGRQATFWPWPTGGPVREGGEGQKEGRAGMGAVTALLVTSGVGYASYKLWNQFN